MSDIDIIKRPIGSFHLPEYISHELRGNWITDISTLPLRLEKATSKLNDEQLDTPYREWGWTIRQVVHHIADSHMNALIRIKTALVEKDPIIRPYDENGFAALADSKTLDIKYSLQLIEALHYRWYVLLQSLTEEQFHKKYFHPINNLYSTVEEATGMYAWHGNHHLSQIVSLIKRMNW